MTLQGALISVGAFTAVAGLSGGFVGGMLGWLTPGYFQQVFPPREGVSLVELGIGLGVTQGIVFGLIAGLIVVVVVAWKETRVSRERTVRIEE